jgi:hypothetical protein
METIRSRVLNAMREISGVLREASLEKTNVEILADTRTSKLSANAICAA